SWRLLRGRYVSPIGTLWLAERAGSAAANGCPLRDVSGMDEPLLLRLNRALPGRFRDAKYSRHRERAGNGADNDHERHPDGDVDDVGEKHLAADKNEDRRQTEAEILETLHRSCEE